jgi:two-component system, chemotaxis family, sensor kinase Cph1
MRNYDAEFCGKIPLTHINVIQPFGALILVDKESLRILQVSTNIENFTGNKPEWHIDRHLGEFIPEDNIAGLMQKLVSPFFSELLPFNLNLKSKDGYINTTAIVQVQEKHFVLEFIDIFNARQNSSFIEVYQELKLIMAEMKPAESYEALCYITARRLKELSGFDKVMVYKFDKNWNGTVVAEAMEPSMDSYLGLWFPASDIPQQARALYQNTPFRYIPDIDYEPVKLFPVMNPAAGGFTDLTYTMSRGVASVHLEYLENMKIKSSMSTRIIKDGQLWGLISCHHRSPKFVSYEILTAFELISNIFSSYITIQETRSNIKLEQDLNKRKSKIISAILKPGTFVDELIAKKDNLLDMLRLSGFVISYNNEIEAIGNTPDKIQIEEIIEWLGRNIHDAIFVTDSFPLHYSKAIEFKDFCSGLIALPLSNNMSDFLICLRPEAIQTINWGGNPNEAVQFEEDKKTYHPRNSFRLWQEQVKFKSEPWLENEIQAAEEIKFAILEKTNFKR